MSRDAITPTPERIAKAGERYQPPATDQRVKRQAHKVKSTIEWMHDKGGLSDEQFLCASDLATAIFGARNGLSIIGSYGIQRWSGTPVSQMTERKITRDWPAECARKVRYAEKQVGDADLWRIVLLVLGEDKNMIEVSAATGESKWTSARRFRKAMHRLAESDYLRLRPKQGS